MQKLRDQADLGLAVVGSLQGALTEWNSPRKQQLNFWKHDPRPLATVKTNGKPYMDREGRWYVATQYLDLPYRVTSLERVLVDSLIALELTAFIEEMLYPKEVAWLPPSSPLRQRHAFVAYLRDVFFGTIFWGAVAFGAGYFLPTTVANWIIGIAFGLWAVGLVLSTLLVPFAWRNQRKRRRNVSDLISAMLSTYAQLDGVGAVSSRHLRELVASAAEKGVVWPGPLFAILDDNIARGSRL